MSKEELTNLIIQSATSLLVIMAVAVLISGIIAICLLVEWHFFPATRPTPQGFEHFEGSTTSNITNL